MWTLLGLGILVVAAVRSMAYALWLWDQKEKTASFGVVFLTVISLALPIVAAYLSNI